MNTTAPRTAARLTTFLYRAAADLDAAAKNARTAAETEHATTGRELCTAMFARLAPR
ncbi:hypothetical protein [Rhodococcoides fascians]|uniref:hypothetical protein n=1 Tax=Rhodococcoides fascians TaxID=1828 RepID=UPI000ADC446C|nr:MULTISPECIES: hypothetical protein [Rhodococcus]